MSMDNPVKPPLGLIPKDIWERELQQVGCDPIELKIRRLVDIFMAMRRFSDALMTGAISDDDYYECTSTWLVEAVELKNELIPESALLHSSQYDRSYARKIAIEFFYAQHGEHSKLPKDALWSVMPSDIKTLLINQVEKFLKDFIVVPRGDKAWW